MKHILLIVMALFAALDFAGCAHSSALVSPAWPALLRRAAAMDCMVVSTASALPRLQPEQAVFNDRVVSALRETSLFPSVEADRLTNGCGAGMKIHSEITAIKKVSDASRLWFGGLAGQARVVAQVTISDVGSGQTIETFTAEGRSGQSARSGTTDEAIQLAAEQVANEVLKINSLSAQ